MNILFIVPYVPNLIRVRPYNLIRYLSQRGHNLTVLTLWTTEAEKESIEQLKAECGSIYAFPMPTWQSVMNCLFILPSRLPLQAAYCWQPSLAKMAEDLLDGHSSMSLKYDLIHVEHLRGVQFGIYMKKKLEAGGRSIPIVWDSVDCISHLFRQSSSKNKNTFSRWLTRFELKRTERYEAWLLNRFSRILITSQVDKKAIQSTQPSPDSNDKITVLPNGVDLTYFTRDHEETREPNTLVISGKMSYHANVAMVLDFYQNILPLVWEKRPNTRLWIVGKDPPKEITRLADNSLITVTGTVSDLRPYLQKATIAVAPLTYGAGIQNKVLESMACSTPVVASPQAVSALNVSFGRDIVVANKPSQFAQAIMELLDNPTMQTQIGQAGRKFVENYHNWSNIVAYLEKVYYEIILAENQQPAQRTPF